MNNGTLTVDSFAGARSDFVAFPFQLYRHDRRWIPPFRKAEEAALNGDHPFSEFLSQQHFLAFRGSKPVARASAFCNARLTDDGAPLGSIGRFESEDDQEAASLVIEAATEWLRQQGVKTIWGPMNGTIWAPYRFMTKGFDAVPFYGEPYNKPYYPRLFEAAGFIRFKQWQSDVVHAGNMHDLMEKMQPRYQKAIDLGYSKRAIDLSRFDEELNLLHRLITDSFAGFAGFHPITAEEFRQYYQGLRIFALPDLIQFLQDPEGEVAGYMCLLPDYPGAIRAMRGEAHLLAKLRFALAKRKPVSYVGLYLGVSKQEQERRSGAGGAIAYLAAQLVNRDQVALISALMADTSFARSWTDGLSQDVREYALYRRAVADSPLR